MRLKISQKLLTSQKKYHPDDVKNKIGMYEKYRSENIANTEETKNNIDGLDSEIKLLKNKIEDSVSEMTNTKYSILQS